MTSTELAIVPDPASAIPAKIAYSEALAGAGLLPASYRKQPANILWAIEYGDMLGLSPMAAITGIHLIDGRPAISAGLISALVRRAGHKLRVIGDEYQAQAEIVRSDDPGFTYKALWTIKRAEQANLTGKQNWRQYPAAMLKARAISEVARDACQEVLLGVSYTPEELGAQGLTDGEADDMGLMTTAQRAEHAEIRHMGEQEAGAVEHLDAVPADDPWYKPQPEPEPVVAPEPEPPHANPAPKSWLDKLQGNLEPRVLGTWPDGDISAMYERITGGPWTASRAQVQLVASVLTDALKAAQGDAEAASASLWKQFHPDA